MIDLELIGADVLQDRRLQPGSLSIAEGKIASSGGRQIDLSGYRVLPGIIDLHGDGFERHLAPRRGAMKDLTQGLASCDAELAANGITTAVLAQFFSWEGGMRGPDFATRFLEALARSEMATDILPQLRFETHMLQDYARFEALVAAHQVPYVVFNDHLPHKALAAGKRPPRLTGQALKGGRSPEAHLEMLQALYARRDEVPVALAALAQRLQNTGVILGSHDDATADARQEWRAMGVAISEFPETLEAAESARAGGDSIVLGAPNVVRGGSHSGNVSAADLVEAGFCDALASDYHYPALRQAVMGLVGQGTEFGTAWTLVSERPAQVLGLADRGSLTVGKRADLVIMHSVTGRIEATLCGGRVSYLTGEAATRFMR